MYHLTALGNARAEIFADLQQGWHCHAYYLMGKHYHLLIETPEPNLVAGMRRLDGVHTQAFNRRHGRVGHVFQGRYKSIRVDKDSYDLEVSRYIVLNPVRARMVNARRSGRAQLSLHCGFSGRAVLLDKCKVKN